jgi:methylase of polypeptide subunit release factors
MTPDEGRALVRALRGAGVKGETVHGAVRVVPVRGRYFFVDSPGVVSPGGRPATSTESGTYGFVGGDGVRLLSAILARTSNRRFTRALDLCTGSGLIGITLAAECSSQVDGVDIWEPAIGWARFNALVNDVPGFSPHVGNLYDPVAGCDPYDLIVANPSFSIFPPDYMREHGIREHEVGGEAGLDVVLRVLDGLDERLAGNGTAFICTATPVINGQDRLAREITRRYATTGLTFDVRYAPYHHDQAFNAYYAQLGISAFRFAIVEINRGPKFVIRTRYDFSDYLKQSRFAGRVRALVRAARAARSG